MSYTSLGKRVCVYISEADRYHHHPLADAILEAARQEGIAGAAVLRGIEGFGPSGHLETNRLLSSSDNLPIVVTFVDDQHRIDRLLPILERMVAEGLITEETVELQVRRDEKANPLDDDE